MIQGSDSAGFPLEALIELLGAQLDRHHTVEACVAGSVHFTHASRADRHEDLVGSKSGAGSEAHRLIPAIQLITTVAGVGPASPTGVDIRNRCPSPVTAYRPKKSFTRASNS